MHTWSDKRFKNIIIIEDIILLLNIYNNNIGLLHLISAPAPGP